MKYLLDTNVISELYKSNCNPKVKAFTDEIPPEDMFISVITVGELCYGMEKLPAGKKKHELAVWIYTKVPEWFNGRILPLDIETMEEWGRLRARAERTLPAVDSQIAAVTLTHHMTLLTRNTKDFDGIEEIMLIDPWEF